MHGLSFVVAALAAAQASAEATDNGYYFAQPMYGPQEHYYGPQYVEQPRYAGYGEHAPRYADERIMYAMPQYAHEPYYGEGRHEILREPIVHHAREDHTRYVEIPEALYD